MQYTHSLFYLAVKIINPMSNKFCSVDLFAGCGGLSVGLQKAGFRVATAVENNPYAISSYKLNHKKTYIFDDDIREVTGKNILKKSKSDTIHLLAGCPPCQGFSSIRRLNKKSSVKDKRNSLILDFLRLIEETMPLTIMMENVPGLVNYYNFKKTTKRLNELGYYIDFKVVNVKDFGVPQSRKRLVLLGSLLAPIYVTTKSKRKIATVRDAIGKIEDVFFTKDPIHKIYPKHSDRIQEMISYIPKDGGSRRSLPAEFVLECHKKDGIGFNDVYGRLSWDNISSTITGGCLNPSKGRFLHPAEDRCISAREAALLQSFPKKYKFDPTTPKTFLARMIGNALPPKFSHYHSREIKDHLDEHYN